MPLPKTMLTRCPKCTAQPLKCEIHATSPNDVAVGILSCTKCDWRVKLDKLTTSQLLHKHNQQVKMNQVRQRPSGVLEAGVAPEPPKEMPPDLKYGPLEIKDPKKRAVAIHALSALWDAMDLSRNPHSMLEGRPNADVHECYWLAWQYFAHLVVGNDAPEKEQEC